MDKLLLVLSLFTIPGSLLIVAGLSNLTSIKEEKDEILYKIAVFLRFTSIFSLVLAILSIIIYFVN